MLKVDATSPSLSPSSPPSGRNPFSPQSRGSDPHTASPESTSPTSSHGLGDDSGSEAGLSPMRRAYSEQILSTTETTALQVATPGPRPALAGAHKEHVLLQLLQRAADTPEELLLYTSELTTAGLLSRTVIEQLCSSLGVRPEVLAAAAGGTPVPTDADAAAPAAADDAGAATAAAEAPPTVFGSLLQAGVLPSRQQLTKLSLHQPQAANIADGLRSRFASEFVPLKKLGHGAFGSVFRARHALDGREYAIKRVAFWLEPGRSGSAEEAAQRALREVQALAVLNHPNVCRYYSAWIETDWASLQPATAAAVRRAQPAVPLLRGPQLVAAMDASEDADAAAAAAASTSGGVIFEDGSSAAPLSAPPPSGNGGGNGDGNGDRDDSPNRMGDRRSSATARASASSEEATQSGGGHSDSSGPHSLTLSGESFSFTPAQHVRAERAALNGAAGMPGAAGGAGMPGARLQWSYRKALFIQMELCEARTLRDYLQARDREVAAAPAERRGYAGVHCAESLNLWHQITAGLHHVHVCGLVHRDLKPANCCFQGSYIKLMDFGLARYYGKAKGPNPMAEGADLAGDGDSPSRARQRVGGTAGVGTPGYAAPEQLAAGELSAACDLFPLGLIGFELFHPFGSAMERAKLFDQLRAQRAAALEPLGKRWPTLAPLLAALLSASPAARPPADALLDAQVDLSRVFRGRTPSPPSSPSPAASPSSVPFGASSPPGPTGTLTDLPPLSPALPPAALPPAAATALPPSCADAAAAASAGRSSGEWSGSGACDDASSAAAQLGRTVLTVSTAGRAPSPEVVAAAAGGSSADADAEGGTPLQQQWRAELEAEQKAHDATREALAAMKAQLQAERDAHMRVRDELARVRAEEARR